MRLLVRVGRTGWAGALTLGVCLAWPTGAFAQQRDLYIATPSDKSAIRVYVSPSASEHWGDDLYPRRRRRHFTYLFEVPIPPEGCLFDVRVDFADGWTFERTKIDICAAKAMLWIEPEDLVRTEGSAAPSRPPAVDKQIRDCLTGTDAKAVLEQCKMAIIMMAYTDDERPRIYAARGRANRRLADYPEALTWLNQAIAINPRDARSLNERGLTHSALNDDAAAYRDYEAAVRVDPANPVYLSNRGAVAYRLDRYEEAERDATAALKLRPEYAAARHIRGLSLRQRGRHSEAIADFTAALAIDPKNDTYLTSRAISHLATGTVIEAADDVREALALAPRNAAALFVRAAIRLGSGDRAGSDADLAAARAINPGIDADMAKRGLTLQPVRGRGLPPAA